MPATTSRPSRLDAFLAAARDRRESTEHMAAQPSAVEWSATHGGLPELRRVRTTQGLSPQQLVR